MEVKAEIAAGAVDTDADVKVIISPLYKEEGVVARAARATDGAPCWLAVRFFLDKAREGVFKL